MRQSQSRNDFRIKLAGYGIHNACGCCICKLLGFFTAKFPNEVFGYHKKIRDTVKPTRNFIRIQLINTVKRLKLTAGAFVEPCKRNFFVYFGNCALCSVITIGIYGEHLFAATHKNIIDTPCVN